MSMMNWSISRERNGTYHYEVVFNLEASLAPRAMNSKPLVEVTIRLVHALREAEPVMPWDPSV